MEGTVKINWLKSTQRRASSRGPSTSYASAAVVKSGRENYKLLSVTFYEPLMNEMRFLSGDRVAIGFTEGYIAIKRTNEDGPILSATGGKGRGLAVTSTTQIIIGNVDSVDRKHFEKSEIEFLADGTVLLPFICNYQA